MNLVERIKADELVEGYFERKRTNFLADHRVTGKPALVWQCRPAGDVVVDLSHPGVAKALASGGGPETGDDWWRGFSISARAYPVFEGLAGYSDGAASGWMTELHHDGSLIAGFWGFPQEESAAGQPTPVVEPFFKEAFADFAFMAHSVYEEAGVEGAVICTATLVCANELPMAFGSHRNSRRPLLPPPARATLRFQLRETDVAGIPEACKALGEQFLNVHRR